MTAQQRLMELRGKATVSKIGRMTQGAAYGPQVIDKTADGRDARVFNVDELGAGTAKAEQDADKVENGGSMTAVHIEKLG